MKSNCIILFMLMIFSSTGVLAQNNEKEPREFVMKEGDKTYVMKRYYMCFLKKGENRDQDEETTAKLQQAHLDNINRLAAEGKIAIAGPFGDDGELRGVFISDVETIEEAEELVKTDPAVKAGRLSYEIHPWWTEKGVQLK